MPCRIAVLERNDQPLEDVENEIPRRRFTNGTGFAEGAGNVD